ncbi:type IV pilus biogenesis/stability protein PilW [Legionella cardiaca]|uniref:Type IV pilus biogenesis/stability protein PilW n=1 Tax=Legionella cardiaca TaxID=1071983 RepID=A0ABY8AW31_9GAMM|nr:type IV pilus biogenesis/stability protein PilW [Legionella cardiaca]WED44381.1 type IV pilus biogenesis/stability protein PilW [Legionella cardiaca]
MLNLLRFLSFFSLTLLAACQHNVGTKTDQTAQSRQKNSEAAVYNMQLGVAYLKQGDMPRAKRKLLTALDLAPNSADANVAMAYYLEKTRDIKNARIYYQKALALAPNNGAQLNNYGTFLCRLGKYTEAESYFLKAANDVRYIHTAAAYENAGLCAAAIPDYVKAKQYFVKALQQDPRRKQSLYELASLELKQKHANDALMYLQKYANLSTSDPILLAMVIDSAHQAGKTNIELDYKRRLSHLNHFTDYPGAKNEYNNSNG